MKSFLIVFLFFTLMILTELHGQSQQIDPYIAEALMKVKSSSEFIRTMNYYLTIQRVEEINKKNVEEYMKICRIINKKNIPIYKIDSSHMELDFYFKKGRLVYNFSLVKKNDLYFSHLKLYTFKKRRLKKEGIMSFRS